MTISDINTQDDALRFPSLDSLRAAHTELLKSFRANGRTPEMVAEIERFIHRGRATGALLDSDADRWAAQTQLDYWSTQLYQPGYEPPDATLDEFDPELAPEIDDALCPYMGLDAFREVNEFVFFGRRRLIGELVDELKNSRFLAVLGSSGSGKSSVVRAGLIPELKKGALPGGEEWIYFPPMVPGSHPLVNLARLLEPADSEVSQAEAESESFRENPNCLPQTVKERFDKNVVMVIDQFEEIFTLCTDEVARRRFVENLIALCKEPNARHRVIITMRSDFEMNIARLPALQDLFEGHIVRVTPLTAAELREAIEAPAARIGLKFEEGVVDALLSDTLGEPAALPLLQFTLLKLWERRERNRVTWESYKKLGGGRQALANSADQVYMRLIPEQRDTMRRILLKMVRPGEGLEVTSNRVPRASLYQKAEAHDRIDRVLERLIKERLVRRSEGDIAGDEQVEIAHEALVRNWPRLVEWLEEDRVTLRQRQRLTAAAEEWQRLGRDSSALWRGVLLEEVRRYDDLNDLEREFVAAGSDAELAERKMLEKTASKMRKRAYYLTAALAVALIAVFAAIRFGLEAGDLATQASNNAEEAKRQAQIADDARIYALLNAKDAVVSEKEAKRQAELALASRLASQAQLITQTQNSRQTVGLLLAIQSMRMNPSNEALQVLQDSLQKNLLGTPRFVLNAAGDSVVLSPDGNYIAGSGFDGQLRIWSAKNGKEVNAISSGSWVTAVAFSPDSRYLAFASDPGTIIISEVLTGKQVGRIRSDDPVYRVLFSPDGKTVASLRQDSTVQLWNTESGKEIAILEYEGGTYAVAFSPDGRFVVTGNADRTARVWDILAGTEFARQTYEGAVYSVAFSPDGKHVVSGAADGTVSVWSVSTGKELAGLKHDGGVLAVTFSSDGQLVLSGSADRTARIWESVSGAEISRLNYDGEVYFVAFSPDGIYALAGGEDATARVWDAGTGQEITRLPHETPVYSAAFSPDGQYVMTSSADGSARIWPTFTRSETATMTHEGWVLSVAYSLDGKYVVSGSTDTTARLWDAASGAEIFRFIHEDAVSEVEFSRDGKYVATASYDRRARVWDAKNGSKIGEVSHGSWVSAVALSPDSKYVISGGCDQQGNGCTQGSARVWEAAAGKEITRMVYKGLVYAVAFSGNGEYVLSGGCYDWDERESGHCSAGIAQVWDPMTGKVISRVDLETSVVSVAFSPDGRYAAAGAENGTVVVWEAATGEEVARLAELGVVYVLSFSPASDALATGADNGNVTVWNLQTGKLQSRLTYGSGILSVTFSPDGRYVAAGSIDNTARVSEAATGAEVGSIVHNDWVRSVAFSPNGEYVVTGSDDGTARVWLWNPEELIERVCSRLPRNLTLDEWSLYMENREYERQCPDLPDPPELGVVQ